VCVCVCVCLQKLTMFPCSSIEFVPEKERNKSLSPELRRVKMCSEINQMRNRQQRSRSFSADLSRTVED